MFHKNNEVLSVLAATLPCVSNHLRNAVADQVGALMRYTDEEPCADPAQEKQRIFQGTYRLLRFIGNMTTAEVLESDALLPRRNEDIVTWFIHHCRQAEGLFAVKGVTLAWDTPLRGKIIGFNAEKLEVALYHLLSNALKFTPAGGTVTVTLRQSGAQVILTVTDTGCGISEELMAVAFERFLHPDLIGPPTHGLGLGLVVSRQIALRHGGRLLLNSAEGQGTTVSVSLPAERLPHDEIGQNRFDYLGGFSHVHINLSDALPPEAFSDAYLDH